MRDNLKDIAQHTHGLGLLKVQRFNENGSTQLEAWR